MLESRPHSLAPCSLTLQLALGVAACQPDEQRPVTIIDDRVLVTFDRPLCRGDITLLEQSIAHTEQSLDIQVESPIEIWIWSRYDDVVDRCSEGPTGCFIGGEIHTLWQSLEHEIVHAVAAPLGRPEPLWAEGIAEALSGRTNPGEQDVESLVGLEDDRDVEYRTAGHFVRWLIEVHGLPGIRALAAESSFEQAYGFDLDDALADYEASAPWSYPHWNPCVGQPLDTTETDAWVHEIAVDCSDPSGSARYATGPTVFRTIDVEEPGTYHLELSNGHSIGLVACQLEVLPEPPTDDMAGDIILESAGLRLPTFFAGDESHEVRLEPGRLLLMLTVEGEGGTATLALRRVAP